MRFPNLVFYDSDGRTRDLKDFRGKVVFLNFGASWCPPCRREMPSIQALYDELRQENIAFILLNAMESFDTTKAWMQSNGYTVPLYRAAELRGLMPLANGGVYVVRRIPETHLLDHNGIVLWSAGETEWSVWFGTLRELLKLSPPHRPRAFLTPFPALAVPHASRVSDRRALTVASFSAPGVILETRLEAGDVGTRLHLTITPAPNVRLAAGPGIIISALQGPVRWLTELPAVRKSTGDYFTEPQEFVLGFLPSGASTVSLKVDYAYCPTLTTCLLSSKVIDVAID